MKTVKIIHMTKEQLEKALENEFTIMTYPSKRRKFYGGTINGKQVQFYIKNNI